MRNVTRITTGLFSLHPYWKRISIPTPLKINKLFDNNNPGLSATRRTFLTGEKTVKSRPLDTYTWHWKEQRRNITWGKKIPFRLQLLYYPWGRIIITPNAAIHTRAQLNRVPHTSLVLSCFSLNKRAEIIKKNLLVPPNQTFFFFFFFPFSKKQKKKKRLGSSSLFDLGAKQRGCWRKTQEDLQSLKKEKNTGGERKRSLVFLFHTFKDAKKKVVSRY